MKNLIFCALLGILLSGCQDHNGNESEWAKVNISCSVIPTKSELNAIKTLHYYFYNTTTGDCIEKAQVYTDIDFGTIIDTLKVGSYDCVVIGYNGDKTESSNNRFSFDKVVETFRGTASFQLEKGNDFINTISLDRINTRVEIISKEKLPTEAKSIKLELSNVSNCFNILSGTSPDTEIIEREFQLRETDIGKENLKFAINCFPCDAKESVLKIKTYNHNGEVLRHIQTDPFQLERNKISRFTGYLFIVFGIPGVGVNLNEEWEGVNEYELPD